MSKKNVVFRCIFRILISTGLRLVFLFYLIAFVATSNLAQSPAASANELSDSLSIKMLEIKKKYLGDSISDSAYLASVQPHLDSLVVAIQIQDEKMVGRALPEATLKTIGGSYFDIDSLRGKPGVLFFWSVTCQPCLDLIPIVKNLQLIYGPKVNMVAFTSNLPRETFDYLDLHGFEVIHLVETRDYAKELGILTVPKILVIDQTLTIKGVFGKFWPGSSIHDLEGNIKDLLDQL